MTLIEKKRREYDAQRKAGDDLINNHRHMLRSRSFQKRWAKHEELVEKLLLEIYNLERKETIKKLTLRSLYVLGLTGTIALLLV